MKKFKRVMRKVIDEVKGQNLEKIISDSPVHVWQFPASETFPYSFTKPVFDYGTRLRWKSPIAQIEADFGVVIGQFYITAPHKNYYWGWNYLILLDKKSPSAAWCVADTAWEEDLKLWEIK